MSDPAAHEAERPFSPGLCLAAAMAVALAAFANGLFGPFLWDDLPLMESLSRLPAGLAAAGRVVTQPFFDWWGCYYRPLTTLSLLAVTRVAGADPVPQHTLNLLGHLLNVALLFQVVRRGTSPRVAALAAAVWGVLPRLTESVTWVSGRTDVFAATAVLGALLVWDGTPARRWGAALLVLAGLLFKEVAVAAVPVLVLREVSRPSLARRSGAKAAKLLPLAAVLALFALLRQQVLVGQFFGDGIRPLARLRLAFESLGTYALACIDVFRPRTFVGDKLEPQPGLALLGLAVAAGLAVIFARALRSGRRGVAEGLALTGGALLPVLHLVPLPIEARAADRFLYLPMAGVAMAVAAASAAWPPRVRRAAVAVALLLVPALAVTAAARNRVYADEIDFWFEALRTAPPGLAAPSLHFADVLLRNGRVAEGLALHRRLLKNPRAARAVPPRLAFNDSAWIGVALAREGRDEEAARLFADLAREDPLSPLAAKSLVLLHLRRGDVRAAREAAAPLRGPEARDASALVDAVTAELADSRPVSLRAPAERRGRARLLGRLGGPRARAAWLDEVEAPDADEATRREGAAWLNGEGTLAEASRAVERVRLEDPGGAGTAALAAALAERRDRELRLDAAIRELGLSGGSVPR